MSKTRIISIKDLTCSTYSVKDNSDRGCHTACKSEIKVGDKVVIDNYFTLVTEWHSRRWRFSRGRFSSPLAYWLINSRTKTINQNTYFRR